MTDKKLRCVVTGLGMISAIGSNVDECWASVLESKSGIDHTHTVDTQNCYADYAAEVKDSAFNAVKDEGNPDRSVRLAVKAAEEALSDAKLQKFDGDKKASVIMGSCVGGVKSIEHYYTKGKPEEDIAKMPISSIANAVAESVEAGGVVTNVANACAAGTISVAYAADLIRAGKADVVIAGGSDAFASVPYAGFLALHALDENGCHPFNRSHGITLGEGAGALVIESLEHAEARGAKIYCEVLGAGISSDAHHITAPRPDGEGQMVAIRSAIAHSGLTEGDVGYINAHGTGTAKNDEAEFLSLHTIFDGKNDDLSVSSTKALTGHCLGAAGAIEAVLSVKALYENVVPATVGYTDEDLEALKEKAGKIDFVPNKVREKKLHAVMSNSFAFGGNNASIIFAKDRGEVKDKCVKKPIVITGLGIVSPLGNGVETYIEAYKEGKKIEKGCVRSTVSTDDYNPLGLKMAFYRKLDNFSQLQAVSGMYALKDAKYEVTEENAFKTGIIVGTSEGALGPGCDFETLIAEHGNAHGSAFKFPNTVYNAAGGYLSICAGVKGYNVTVTNGAQSGLQSFAYAMNVLRNGWADAMLATGSDENSDIMDELYKGLDLVADEYVAPYAGKDKFSLSDGSVSVMLETEEEAKKRGAKVYAHVSGYGMAHKSVPFGTIKGSDEALDEAVKLALIDGGVSIDDIDAVIGFADGHKVVDDIELGFIERAFKDKAVPVISVKERTGEARAASAALAAMHGALLLSGELKESEAYLLSGDKKQKTTVKGEKLNNILAISFGSGGSYCALVIAK